MINPFESTIISPTKKNGGRTQQAKAAYKSNPTMFKAAGGAAFGLIAFLLQVYGISALIDNLRKPEERDYVLAPSAAVKFYAEESIEDTVSEEEGGISIVTDEGEVVEVEEVPEEVVPPEVVIDRFQMLCMTFSQGSQQAIKLALVVGLIQLIFNFIVNMSNLLSDKLSPTQKAIRVLPLVTMDLILLFSLINLFTTLQATIKDVYGEPDDICLRVKGTQMLPFLRFNAGFWLFYAMLHMPIYAYSAYKL